MTAVLLILLICAAADVVGCLILLAVVWAEHRRVRRGAAAAGEHVPSVAGTLGCLAAFGLFGLAVLYGAAWLLLRGAP